MIIQSEIKKWGNSLGLRVTGVLKDIPNLHEGSQVEIEVNETGFTVKPIHNHKSKLPFTEKDLLDGLTPYSSHSDLLAIPIAEETEWSE